MASSQTRLAGLVRTTYCNASKSAINTWLAQLVADIAGTGIEALWCLLLETHELQTLKALEAAGVNISFDRILVPNPSEQECSAMHLAAPGIHSIPCASHTLLAELSTSGINPNIPGLSTFRKQWECGKFDFVWLDYCGTLMFLVETTISMQSAVLRLWFHST
ncbi:unnamed protein product [Durusdinium trenchii]|uniref:Uncharacterized protein n=1 Tax=Durusdinium trenchii TaxID=1381693 RepID=A0ABP0JG48_9DINO